MMSSSLPEDIYLDILSRIPAKSTFVCKCVCKTWYSLISDPDFVKKHLNLSLQRNKPNLIIVGLDFQGKMNIVFHSVSNSSLKSIVSSKDLYDSVKLEYPFNSIRDAELLGSCHGILCLLFKSHAKKRDFLCLWNPATKEYKRIPKSPYDDYNDGENLRNICMAAFWFDAKSDDYKLLTRYRHLVQVYSLGLNAWRGIQSNMEFHDHEARQIFNRGRAGVLVYGEPHWLAENPDSSHIIVSFDVSKERFTNVQLPKELLVNNNNRVLVNVGVLEECLCLLVGIRDVGVELWVMEDYGVPDSWTKRHVINSEFLANDDRLRLVWYFESGEILFYTSTCKGLVLYDPKDGSVGERHARGLVLSYNEAFYIESLVPLNSNTYQGRRTRGTRKTKLPPRIPQAPRPPFRV